MRDILASAGGHPLPTTREGLHTHGAATGAKHCTKLIVERLLPALVKTTMLVVPVAGGAMDRISFCLVLCPASV